jgi:hypothetical protein
VFQHLLQWLQVIGYKDADPDCYFLFGMMRVDVVGIGGGPLLVRMFEAPYSLHTHIRSSLYI